MSSALIEQGFVVCSQQTGFSSHVGPFYERQSDGRWQRALPIEQKHLNPEGVAHGGVALSFVDYVIYRAIGDEIGHDIQFATINLNTNFVAAAKAGSVMMGSGNIVKKTKSVIFAEGLLNVDDRPILQASGIWKIIGSN